MDYLRPKTIEEAIELLTRGVPLAGGIELAAKRYGLDAVIDLQFLELDELQEQDGVIQAGAMVRLQQLVVSTIDFPRALQEACRYESAWNIRNQATLGGILMSADGRSPLLTVLAAMDPEVMLAPGDETVRLAELLERRREEPGAFLILSLRLKRPKDLAYDFVARAPMDRPLVSAAAAFLEHDGKEYLQVAMGGYGESPSSWSVDVEGKDPEALLTEISGNAIEQFKGAGDAFASAEYRSEIAGVLSRRVVREVLKA
jgi:CO/xanthine dehydrogenase FAD-binding subunit